MQPQWNRQEQYHTCTILLFEPTAPHSPLLQAMSPPKMANWCQVTWPRTTCSATKKSFTMSHHTLMVKHVGMPGVQMCVDFCSRYMCYGLLTRPVLIVVPFQSTGQFTATVISLADWYQHGSVLVTFVVQMDTNAAHARPSITNKKSAWHMQLGECWWKLIHSHLQYILFHHQCIHNSLPSTVTHIPPQHASLTQMLDSSKVVWCLCSLNEELSFLFPCATLYLRRISAIPSNRPFNTTTWEVKHHEKFIHTSKTPILEGSTQTSVSWGSTTALMSDMVGLHTTRCFDIAVCFTFTLVYYN